MLRLLAIPCLTASLFLFGVATARAGERPHIVGKWVRKANPKHTVKIEKKGDVFRLTALARSGELSFATFGIGIIDGEKLVVSYFADFSAPYYSGPPINGTSGPVVIVYRLEKDRLVGRTAGASDSGKIEEDVLIRQK